MLLLHHILRSGKANTSDNNAIAVQRKCNLPKGLFTFCWPFWQRCTCYAAITSARSTVSGRQIQIRSNLRTDCAPREAITASAQRYRDTVNAIVHTKCDPTERSYILYLQCSRVAQNNKCERPDQRLDRWINIICDLLSSLESILCGSQ